MTETGRTERICDLWEQFAKEQWLSSGKMADSNNNTTPISDVESIELEIKNGLEQVRDNTTHVDIGNREYELTIPFKVGDDKRTFTITDVLDAADHLETDELATLIDNLYESNKSGENLEK